MKRIFFAEDDLSLINGLSFAMEKQGYEIDIARTSLEAEALWINLCGMIARKYYTAEVF